MSADANPVVLVNFEVDSRELFRATLALAKWRFLIGIVVVFALVLPLAYLFIVIGEQKVFLQTSPLFVGVPLIAIAAQVLRIHSSLRKYVKALSDSQRQIKYVFQAESDGYDYSSGGSFGHSVWQDIEQVVEKDSFFLIVQNRFRVGLLPKRAFQENDLTKFRSIISSSLGQRAKLLTT